MITPEDKKEIQQMIIDTLLDVKQKKIGDSPLEFFDLVNRGYLQQNGTNAQRPAAGLRGRMFFNTSSARAQWDDGTNWRDYNANIV